MKTKISIFSVGVLACFLFMQFVLPNIPNLVNGCVDTYNIFVEIAKKRSAPVEHREPDPLWTFMPSSLPSDEKTEEAIKELILASSAKPGWRETGKAGFEMRLIENKYFYLKIKTPNIKPGFRAFIDENSDGISDCADSTVCKEFYAGIQYAMYQLAKI